MFKDAYGSTMSKSKKSVNSTNIYQQCSGQISVANMQYSKVVRMSEQSIMCKI